MHIDPQNPQGRFPVDIENNKRKFLQDRSAYPEEEPRETLVGRIEKLERELTELRMALGLLTVLHPTMIMDPDDPVAMAKKIYAYVKENRNEY